MSEDNFGGPMLAEIGVKRRAVHGVAFRRISTVGPINESLLQIELEINWLRQTIEQKFDVGAVRRGLATRDVDLRTKDAALARVVGTFLRPINLAAIRVDAYPDAPFRLIGTRASVAFACID